MEQHQIKLNLPVLMIIFLSMASSLLAQNLDYDFESWQGKNNSAKSNMQIPSEFIKKHKMELIKGSNGNKFFYLIRNNQIDSPADQIQVGVFQSSTEAQLRLLSYLNDLTSPFKLTKLSKEYSFNADIAFGNTQNETSFLVFTKNNVFIMVRATSNRAQEIADTFINIINNSPDWKEEDSKPCFKLENN